MLTIEEEQKCLTDIGFLTVEDSSAPILTNIYQYSGWAEIFWRRRGRHEQRPDPELTFIKNQYPKTILEIGCGYGRFTKKILETLQYNGSDLTDIQIIGLELNKTFNQYIQLYTQQNPILKNAQFLFSDILQLNTFKLPLFELIIIPMHTIPYFTKPELDKLFSVLYNILAKNGQCIFSVHKNLPQNDNTIVFPTTESYSGELLVEKSKSHIVSLNYSFPIQKSSEGGYLRVEYSSYVILDEYFQIKEKIIARHGSNIYTEEILQKMFIIKGFKIDFIDTQTITRVYSVFQA